MMETTDQNRGIIHKEYGRNIQKIVQYIMHIDDREKRSRYAYTLIELMKQINPNIRDQENPQKIWDHLYIMSDFQLDVDTEFPMPEKSILGKKPMRVNYNTHNLRFKHYGRNIELLIEKAIETNDPEEKESAIIYLGRLMKRFYAAWNKENIEDELIALQLEMMSDGKLKVDLEKVKANNLFDSHIREKDYAKMGQGGYQQNQGRQDYKQRHRKQSQQHHRKKN